MSRFLSFQSVSFRYPESIHPIFTDLSLELGRGWTGITGENGAGKTTFLELAAGGLTPDAGTVRGPETRCLCRQRTDSPPEELEEFLFSGDGEAFRLMSLLSIGWDWFERWNVLSHGERKRVQIATALWKLPELLALDEPTNHLDVETKDLLVRSLSAYEGTGLIISHDREVLDALCSRCLFIRNGRAVVRPGGVSAGLIEEERERTERAREHKKALKDLEKIRKEADARKRIAESSRSRTSKRGLKPGDHDARGKINLARVSGKDAVGGKLFAQYESRLAGAGRRIEETAVDAVRKTGVRMRSSRSKSDYLFRSESTVLTPGAGMKLSLPPLEIRPDDRIALTGANGSGKTTLVRFVTARTGTGGEVLYIPQELDAQDGARVLRELKELSPEAQGETFARFSRLGSDPERLLSSANPSPGETRKLLFAMGVLSSPSLVIMDEPTNHLDLTSIRLLEEALSEIECALLLVSHDRVFLGNLTDVSWAIRPTGGSEYGLIVSARQSHASK